MRPKVKPACVTVHRDRTPCPPAPPPRSRTRSWRCVGFGAAARRRLALNLGVPARTVSRVLRRRGVPYLCDCDPMTGELIRSSKATAVRYERERPGELVHMDVKKLGRIPDGGGWRAHGSATVT